MKKIQQMCGTVSYKRGLSFFENDKVEIVEKDSSSCKAIVHGVEPFHVELIDRGTTQLKTSCTCPTLDAVTYSCQHVAAVLIALNNEQEPYDEVSANFLEIFSSKQATQNLYKKHFETRQLIEVGYVLKPSTLHTGEKLWQLSFIVDQTIVTDSYAFLRSLANGEGYGEYHPTAHAFSELDDTILTTCIQIIQQEQKIKTTADLCIPPLYWTVLLPLFQQVGHLEVFSGNSRYYQLQLATGVPPFQFVVSDEDDRIRLKIARFEEAEVFPRYEMVFFQGIIYHLEREQMERLVQVKQLVQATSEVYIASQQIEYFMTHIVPNLRKLGEVKLSPKLQSTFLTEKLKPHLYLDRINGRLLAGVEFHYGKVVIQPLEPNKYPHILRDDEREMELLSVFEESGFSKTEGGFFMQNDALEYAFLTDVLPRLQKQMQVYATMAIRLRITKSTVFPKIRVKAHTERTNWVEFKFDLEGIRDADIHQVIEAIRTKQKFYKLPNGSLMSLETKEIEELQRFLNEVPIQDDGYEQSFQLPLVETLQFTELFEDSDAFEMEETFKQVAYQLTHPETLAYEVPKNIQAEVRPYQIQGFKWMKLLANFGFGGVLADDMGLGKTLQSILFIVSELEKNRRQQKRTLIVCPSAVTYNWLNELIKFAPEVEAVVIDGTVQQRRKLLADLQGMDVFITSYPLLRQDIQTYQELAFETIFFDEAQAFKNPYTQTARTVLKLKANTKFALTGTPIENTIEEIWAIYRVVFPHLFGTLQQYSELQTSDIARRLKPFMLRRMKEDVLGELPNKVEQVHFSELQREQKKLYTAYLAQLKHDTFKHIGKQSFKKNKIRILAGITRLRQLCCHPSLFVDGYEGSSAKFEQLFSILQEAKASGRRVLVFSQFTQMLQLIAQKLYEENESFYYLDGSTSSAERVQLCQQFNDGQRDLFLISLKAGGTGLNLTGADTVILYDLWWNPAVEEQAADRAHRMGQKKQVEVLKLIARGTIEEKIHELQQKKKHLIADVLEENEFKRNELTEEDIREILMIDDKT